jgi:putative phosphoribosyl transferase
MEMVFTSREDAGRQLGRRLLEQNVGVDLVLGLPRGGVVVAAEVARAMRVPLDVLIVRKVGHPLHREFAVGALAEGDVLILDQSVIGPDPIVRAELSDVIQEEKQRLRSYQSRFHKAEVPDLGGKTVLLVDDGLATGATTEAAVLSARKQGARQIIVSAPVASLNAVERLRHLCDEVVVLFIDADFDAVGRYYDSFSQTTDEEVLDLLNAA